MLTSFLAGGLAGYGIAIPVGPIAILIIELGVRRGLRVAAAAGLGAATADLAYATLAVVAGAGIAAVLEPWSPLLKVAAVAVLVVLAVRGVRRSLRVARGGVPAAPLAAEAPARTYGRFLVITLLNPQTVLYFTALILGRPSLGSAPLELVAFVAGAALASASWQLLLAVLGALFHQRLPARVQLGISLLGNLVVAGFAVAIARTI